MHSPSTPQGCSGSHNASQTPDIAMHIAVQRCVGLKSLPDPKQGVTRERMVWLATLTDTTISARSSPRRRSQARWAGRGVAAGQHAGGRRHGVLSCLATGLTCLRVERRQRRNVLRGRGCIRRCLVPPTPDTAKKPFATYRHHIFPLLITSSSGPELQSANSSPLKKFCSVGSAMTTCNLKHTSSWIHSFSRPPCLTQTGSPHAKRCPMHASAVAITAHRL